MKREIKILASVNGFAEDKDLAKHTRTLELLPALQNQGEVVLDFRAVKYATQSFVHALIGEPLKIYGEEVLKRMEFKNCSSQLRNIIELVVDYSLGEFIDKPR